MELPAELRNAVNQEVTGRSAKDLAKVVEGLSARYRSSLQEPAHSRLVQTLDDAVAYAAFRLPATYGAVYGALRLRQGPAAQVSPPLSLGCGCRAGHCHVGSSHPSLWQDCLLRSPSWRREEATIGFGKAIGGPQLPCRHPGGPVGGSRHYRKVGGGATSMELVVAAYVLGELNQVRPGKGLSTSFGTKPRRLGDP